MVGKKLFIVTVLASLLMVVPASALRAETQRINGAEEALGGLTTIHSRIHYYEDGVPRDTGQALAQLQSDLERMLTDAGIKLAETADFDRLVVSRSFPIALLEMELRTAKIPDTELKSYILSIKIRQPVFLSRKPVVRFLASSWESLDFGAAKDFPFVREVAKEALGRFVQDLRAQNPK
jgi:hypothetical protein